AIEQTRQPAIDRQLASDGGAANRAAIAGEAEVTRRERGDDGVRRDLRLLHADGDALAGERVDAGRVSDGDEARPGDRCRRLVAERGPAASGARQRDAETLE